MRYDINILWVEDSQDWQKKAEALFRLRTSSDGLLLNIDYVSKDAIPNLETKIRNETNGYKLFDIIFIDYNISQNVTGDKIIEALRESNIDADILFYSANLGEEQKKNIILDSGTAFDGIYLADRSDFQEKAIKLYKKNTKRLTSLLNIRGLLTDKTSENDFIMKSYLLQNIDNLTPKNKEIIEKEIKSILDTNITTAKNNIEKGEKLLTGISTITSKKLFDLPEYILPIVNKYYLFSKLLELNNSSIFDESYSIEKYNIDIIKMRNTLAHKKIDVCKQQKYLKYYDTIKQFIDRQCPPSCDDHSDEKKISLEQWYEVLKTTNEYSKRFDELLDKLIDESNKSDD